MKRLFLQLYNLQQLVGAVVQTLERLESSQNWSSVPVSLAFFSTSLLLALCTSAALAFVPVSWFVCVGGCLVLLPFMLPPPSLPGVKASTDTELQA